MYDTSAQDERVTSDSFSSDSDRQWFSAGSHTTSTKRQT
ncbi:hypothetical protein OH492_20935 [Vibrio chagasii]|nr:hypothetical protein [Vibrio chagasii]